jgi:hypothetical protein
MMVIKINHKPLCTILIKNVITSTALVIANQFKVKDVLVTGSTAVVYL